jgi:hypothetical protein
MRQFSFLAITTFILASFGGWIAATSQERVIAPTYGVSINPMQVMAAARNLPTQHAVGYSLIY